MINQELLQYIQQNLSAGYDINSIKTALINQGFQPNDVDDTINYVNSRLEQPKGGAQMVMKNNIQYGGFWIRFSAMVWDGIILGIPSGILQLILAWITGISSMIYVVSLAVVVITIYMDGIKGGTPGKLILGLRIKNEKEEYIGIPMAILRYIGKILSGLILGIGYLMIGWDKRKQGLHDKIASTFVIKTPGVERKALFVIGLILGILPILLLPLLVAIGSVAYFGVLAPQKFLPESCSIPSGLACVDFQTGIDGATKIKIQNGMGEDLTGFTLSLENECTPKEIELKDMKRQEFTCIGKKGKAGESYKQEITITYKTSATGLSNEKKGSLITRYE